MERNMWLVLALKESYRHHLLGIQRDILGLHFGKVWAGLEVIWERFSRKNLFLGTPLFSGFSYKSCVLQCTRF